MNMHLIHLFYFYGNILWYIFYIIIIIRGFKDKSYGMPLIPLALNLSWEICYAYIFLTPMAWPTKIWLFLDFGILATYILYAPKYFKSAFGINKQHWLILSMLVFVGMFFLVIQGIVFFVKFDGYFKHDAYFVGGFLAYFINFIIAVCSLLMLWTRKSSAGQSFYGVVFRGFGTMIYSSLLYFVHPADFITTICIFTGIVDIYYAVSLFIQLKKESINPWKRL